MRERNHSLPHLHVRADSGQFTYVRIPDPRVAALTVGRIERSWCLRPASLTGAKVIKFSLGTKDAETAAKRWGEVYHQVEALVTRAAGEEKQRARNGGPTPTPVASLSDDQRSAIAGQARHDILADDDRAWVQPDYANPTARAAYKAADGHLSKSETDDRAREIEAGLVKHALASRQLDVLDMKLTIHENDMTSADVDEILRKHKAGISFTEQEKALRDSHEKYPGAPLSSELTERLAENGFSMPAASEHRRMAGLAVLRAKAQAHGEIELRLAGRPIDTPPRPQRLTPSPIGDPADSNAGAAFHEITLDQMHQVWVKLKTPEEKTISHNRLYVSRFKQIIGDMPMASITRAHIRRFRDTLLHYPRNLPRQLATATPQEVVAWTNANPGLRRLTRRTINNRAIGGLSTLFETAIREIDLKENPCAKTLLPIRQEDEGPKRQPFTVKDLNALFASEVFGTSARRYRGGGKEAQKWIPLLATFTGARLEELGQLHVSDIRRDDDIHVIVITECVAGGANAAKKQAIMTSDTLEKHLKTAAAERMIPIHPTLIKLGFLEYVEKQRQLREERLFPAVKATGNRCAKNFSRWWARYQDDILGADPAKVFHSFRHSFIDAMREGDVEESVIQVIVGHAGSTTTSRYGNRQLLRVAD